MIPDAELLIKAFQFTNHAASTNDQKQQLAWLKVLANDDCGVNLRTVAELKKQLPVEEEVKISYLCALATNGSQIH